MIYLLLGTNLGDREANLAEAIKRLSEAGVRVLKRSSIYETEPRDYLDQPWFLNTAVECLTVHPPMELLRRALLIEEDMGRDRSVSSIHRGPRLIDIDILLYDGVLMEAPQLTLPHPRMLERRFVLEPLLELDADLTDPRTQLPLSNSLTLVRDQSLARWPKSSYARWY